MTNVGLNYFQKKLKNPRWNSHRLASVSIVAVQETSTVRVIFHGLMIMEDSAKCMETEIAKKADNFSEPELQLE